MKTEKIIEICGLGVYPPRETTLETLQILGDCGVVLTDVDDEKVLRWLKSWCKKVARVDAAAVVLAEVKKTDRVGLAVWGHPQFSSRLAREVQLKCRKDGVPYRVSGAISPIGSVFARSVSFLGGDYGYQGIQAYDLETLLDDARSMTTTLPLVVYAQSPRREEWRKLFSILSTRYPAAHEVRVYASGAPEESVLALGKLKDQAPAVLLVPPLSSGAKR